jgi:hypothetical protein
VRKAIFPASLPLIFLFPERSRNQLCLSLRIGQRSLNAGDSCHRLW